MKFALFHPISQFRNKRQKSLIGKLKLKKPTSLIDIGGHDYYW